MDTYYTDQATTGALLGVLAGVFLIIMLFALVIWIIQVVGLWKMFKKANQPGWPALIPIYNTYILCKVTGVNPWWILIVLLFGTFGNLIPVVGALVSAAASIYFMVLLYVSTARSYGKEDAWAIGLFFLQPFFMLALGVGKSEYKGATPMEDIVGEKVGLVKKDNTTTPTTEAPKAEEVTQVKKQCPSCGTEVDGSTKFCPSCGKEV